MTFKFKFCNSNSISAGSNLCP
uniref:Uncharacterized protein n=1 Tax=Anguilla anguilla TaxID=7936 RepID=A0A0E9P9H7_ANGAN